MKTEGITALSKSVTISTNDPRQPSIVLNVTAVAIPEFALSERSIYFGSVAKGKEVAKEIVITIQTEKADYVPPEKVSLEAQIGRSDRTKEVRLLGAESTDQNVAVKLEPVPDSNGKKVKLVAVQKANAKDGYHFGTIIIKTTSTLTPELRISVRGMITAGQTN